MMKELLSGVFVPTASSHKTATRVYHIRNKPD